MSTPKKSPWGTVQHATKYGEHAHSVSTAGHGGLKLDRRWNARVPDYMRQPGGWYEEDCLWAVPVVCIPELADLMVGHYGSMTADDLRREADLTLLRWFPSHWAKFHGKPIEIGMSRSFDQDEWERQHAGDWVAVSALSTDDGSGVIVVATLGGKRSTPLEPVDERWYLVTPRDAYNDPTNRHPLGLFAGSYVIRPEDTLIPGSDHSIHQLATMFSKPVTAE